MIGLTFLQLGITLHVGTT